MPRIPAIQRNFLATAACAFFAAGGWAAHPTGDLADPRAPSDLRLRLVPPDQASTDLSKLSFQAVSELVEGVEDGAELVLSLPFVGKSSFEDIEVAECDLVLDKARRSLVVAGTAKVRGIPARVFLSGTFPASGPGQYAFGVRPDVLKLGQWFKALEGTPLAEVEFEAAGMVLAGAPHALPSSALVTEILGLESSGDGLEVEAGVGLRASIAAQSLPAVGKLLERLGIAQSSLRLAGRLSSDVDLLLGANQSKTVDIELLAELEATDMEGLKKRLPTWVQPTKLAPNLEISYASASGLVVGVGFEAAVKIGGESRAFSLSSQIDSDGSDATVTMRGSTVGAWERPLGIEWMSLQGADLVVTLDGKQADAKLFSTIRLGTKQAKLDLVVADDGSAELKSRLDSISIGDLASFVSERTGSSFLSDLELGDASQLQNMALTLAHTGQTNSLEVAATAGLGGAQADLLFSLTSAGKGKPEPFLVIRRRAGHLSDLLPALAGKPADLEFPEAVWTLTPVKAAGETCKLSSADLAASAREFLRGVYGSNFEIELEPGIHFGAKLPFDKLPPILIEALGIEDRNASLVLEGSLRTSLDFGTGRPSASIQSLDLHAVLPRVAGKTSRLPEGLPSWMRLDSSSQRTLTVRYAAPSNLTFLKTNDVLADLDGETRHFQIATVMNADSKQGSVSLSGGMVGEWNQPFGLKALRLRDVTLATEAGAKTGKGGKRTGSLVLEGGFDLGPKSGRMQLEIAAASGAGVSGSFTGTLDSLSLADLSEIDLFPNLPKEGLERLVSTLGKLPPLDEPTLHVTLGGSRPSISFSAHADLRGVRANLLVFASKGKGGAQSVVGIRPDNFSLAKLFPKLGQSPAVAGIANLSLERFGLLAVHGDQTLKASEVDPEVRDFFASLTGEKDFELKLTDGLNLEARIPADQLPEELTQALDRMNESMGLDSPAGLSLRGTIGTSLADLRLAAALPPIRPGRAPAWLKSGQMAFVLTGAPSFMLTATLTVDCEGDILDLIVEGGVERQGGNVAIALKSALQADKAWTSPFGMEWLEIRRFSGQLSIDGLANVGFGGGGNLTVGSKDIDVFAWTKINAATGVPMGLVVKAESKAGLALLDLAELQGKMRTAAGVGGPKLLPLDRLPDIAVRDFALLIASRAVPEEGIDSAGFKLKGDLYVPLKPGASGTKLVSVACEVSNEGILAKGTLGAYCVGPLTWEDSFVDLEATLASQHLSVHGRIELLGSSSETDLQLDREGLSFETTRVIAGLGATHLVVKSEFDLKKPSFYAHGQLDNEFGKTFGESALGELADVGGKAAAVGALALDTVAAARGALEAAREEAGLPTVLETIDAIAAQRVKDAEGAAKAHKIVMDRKYKEWQDTPTSKPALRKTRELIWGQSKMSYDEGPLSKIKVLERRKAQYESIHAGLAALEAAKQRSRLAQATLGEVLQKIADYPGKTIVVTSASIESSLEGLQSLKDGMPVDMTLELSFCGEPKTVNIPWIVGKPAVNAKMVIQALIPDVCQLVNE